MWKDLSMAERAKYIKIGIDNNISDINEISRTYNRYADGGYKAWKEKAKQWREGIDIDSPNPTYDYEGFFNEDPQRAWDMINIPDSEEHFTDKYKLPNHPTFSDESIYSTPPTLGGHWSELNGKGFYIPSKYTGTPERLDSTRDYLMNTGEGYAVGNEVHYPSTALDSQTGYELPELEVLKKYDIGGDLETPIKNPVIPKSDDPQAIKWLANWLNNRRAQLNENIASMEGFFVPYITKPANRRRGDIRRDGYDMKHIDVTYNPLLYLKGLNPERIRTNKAYYAEINNAASAPQIMLSDLPTSSFDLRGAYLTPDYTNNTGHWIGYPGIPDNGTNIHERTHAMNAVPQERKVASIIDNNKYKDKYLDDSKEIYARLNTIRYITGLSPSTVVTTKWLNSHRKELKNQRLDRYTDDELLQLFNDVADNPIGIEGLIQDNITSYGGKINKFDGLSTPSNQMNKVQYIDTEGNIYNNIPKGFVKRSQLTKKGRQIADDLYRRNNPTELDELIVYPSLGKGARSTSIGSYYDKANTMTEANMEHAKRVAQSDALVRETSAFEKPLNFLSPGQWFGATVDYYQGESPFWEGIYNGNSGWVTDKYAREHPGMAVLVNMAGDAAFGELAGLTYKNIRTGVNRYNYERNLYNNIDNFNTVTPDDISRIAQRSYPYTHEKINPFTSNSRWGRRFRANIGKVFYPDAEMPTIYRKTNPVPDIVEGNIQMTNPRTRWVDTNDQPFTVTNMTTDLPVRPHKAAKRGWQESNAYAYSGDELLDYDLWSTRPSDTFSINEHVEVPVSRTRVVSGDADFIGAASQKGLNVTTNEKLKGLYKGASSSDRLTKADYGPYAKAVQEEVTSPYRRPTARDYKYMDFVYRPVFRSNVFDRALFTDPVEAAKTVYGKPLDELDQFHLKALEEDWLNSNILYDSSTPAEHGLRGILGIKRK